MEFHSRAGASVSIYLERVSGYFSNFFSKGSATLESGSITGHFNPDNQGRRSQDIWDLGPDNWRCLSLRKKDNNLEIRILLELCFQDFFNSKLIFLKSTQAEQVRAVSAAIAAAAANSARAPLECGAAHPASHAPQGPSTSPQPGSLGHSTANFCPNSQMTYTLNLPFDQPPFNLCILGYLYNLDGFNERFF